MQFPIDKLTTQVPPEQVRSVLLISFEDQELIDIVRVSYSGASITVFVKQDLAGLSVPGLFKKIRGQRYDLIIVSLHNSTVRRSQSSIELLLTASRARQRLLRVSQETLEEIHPLLVLPDTTIRIALGIVFVIRCYISVFLKSLQNLYSSHRKLIFNIRSTKGRVLFLRTDLPGSVRAGGSVSHVKGMIKAFQKSGFEVIYVADAPLESLPKDVVQISITPMAQLDIFDEFQQVAYNFQCLAELKRAIKKYQPIIIYQRHAIFSFAGALTAQKAGIPFVLEANDSEVWIKKHWSRLVFEDLAIRCERLVLTLSDVITVISKGVREQLDVYDIPTSKYILNPNGVDPEEFHPDIDAASIRHKYKLDSFVIVGFIGTFTRWHGVEALFEASIVACQKEERLRFLFIGDGDLRSLLEKRSQALGLTDRLIFSGLVPHNEAPMYLAACDILVSPHLGFSDGTKFFGSPTKLFEYMAMGKPIIATNLEQIGEVIVDGVNGLHMEPGNVDQLSNLILKLAEDRSLREQLGAQARKDVLEKYTWDKNVERIIKVLY